MATIRRFFEGPFNFIDVSNNCGDAERRLGLAEMGGLPDGFVLSTKVDRDPVTGRFDGSRVRRSFEESVTPSWARPRSESSISTIRSTSLSRKLWDRVARWRR